MRVDLAGRTALVTGGARGIGRAVGWSLAENGATVVLMDLDGAAAEATAAEIRQAGHRCRALPGDVTDRVGMAALAATAAEPAGLDILVNNAGINTRQDRVPLHEYSPRDWQRILDVDLTGVYNVSRAVLPYLLAGGGGRIVNVSSIAGLVPLRLQSAYVAAKAGVAQLTRAMALEYGPQGVLVNAVAPGSTLTQGTEALFYGPDGAYTEKAASLLSHIPLGRAGTPEEIAAAVLFLVAPEASYVNGHILTVDGGWTAGYTRDW